MLREQLWEASGWARAGCLAWVCVGRLKRTALDRSMVPRVAGGGGARREGGREAMVWYPEAERAEEGILECMRGRVQLA